MVNVAVAVVCVAASVVAGWLVAQGDGSVALVIDAGVIAASLVVLFDVWTRRRG